MKQLIASVLLALSLLASTANADSLSNSPGEKPHKRYEGAQSTTLVSVPTGTTSTTGVMLGIAATLTPKTTGRALVIMTGDIKNNTSAGGANIAIRYGTGAAPANGAAITGTLIGPSSTFFNSDNTASFANLFVPGSVSAIVTGLQPGTQYWFDTQLKATSTGTATYKDVNFTIVEF